MGAYDIKILSNIIFKPASVIAPAQYTKFLYQRNLKKYFDYPKDKYIKRQPIELYSEYDYILKANWYTHQEASDRLIFLVPGYATVQLEMDYLAPFFLNLGYDVVTFNTYAYGNNNALVTFGNRESEDFVQLYEGVITKANYQYIGLFGHSMGANTVLRAGSKITPAPDFIIASAPFNRLDETIASHVSLWTQKFNVNRDNIAVARKVIKQAEENWGKQLLPLEAMTSVAKLSMPVLYLHGTDDQMNPFYMSQELVKVTNNAQIEALPKADHLDMFIKTKQAAEEAVISFMNFALQGK